MTFDEDTDPLDGYDPIVAERFEVLDRVTPPAVAEPGAAGTRAHAAPLRRVEPGRGSGRNGPVGPQIAARPAGEPRIDRRSPWYIGAAAASLLVVAGVALFALASRGGDQDVEASDGDGTETSATDDATGDDQEGQADSLTVELPANDAGEGDEGIQSSDPAGGEAAQPAEDTGDDQGGAAVDGSSQSAATTGSTEAPVTSTVTVESETTTTTAVPTTTTTTNDATETTPSWSLVENQERVVVVRGMVTEVHTDCQSRLVLNEQNQVESVGPVNCDSGSYIIVNGNRIQTSSGYVAADDHFDKHMMGLKPGQSVTVTALPSGRAGGPLTLDCPMCGIRLGG